MNFAERFDPRALAIVLFVGVIEFELYVFARPLVEIAGRDAWLSVLLGGILVAISTYLLVKLAARFPRENLFTFNKKVWGRPIAFIIALGFFGYWAAFLGLLLRDAITATRVLFLPQTPTVITLALILGALSWLAYHGFPAVIRLLQLMLLFLIVPLIPLWILGFGIIEIDRFMPVLENGFVPVLQGAVLYAGLLQGIEVILFIGPFLTDAKKALRPALVGVGAIVMLNVVNILLAIGILGPENTRHSLWPGIETVTLLELPGFPVERWELFLTLPSLIAVFTTAGLFMFLLSSGIIQIFKIGNRSLVIGVVAIVIAGLVFVFPNYIWAVNTRQWFFIPTLVFVYAVPVLTLVVANLRGKGDGR